MARKQMKSGTTSDRVSAVSPVLIEDIRQIIGEARRSVATTINAGLTLLYWRIGKRIVDEVLGKELAAYGQQIVVSVARQLVEEYGPSFGEKNLRRMMQFAEVFPEEEIVVSLIRQLSWTHFIALIPLKEATKRDFYAEMCRIERWNVKTLRSKIDSMLYERTALSRKPELVTQAELENLRKDDLLTPNLVFKDPYFLEFLNLNDRYLEKDLEDAIMREIEQFLLELGGGFSFLARQKRITIDDEDFHIDLLFFHRDGVCSTGATAGRNTHGNFGTMGGKCSIRPSHAAADIPVLFLLARA